MIYILTYCTLLVVSLLSDQELVMDQLQACETLNLVGRLGIGPQTAPAYSAMKQQAQFLLDYYVTCVMILVWKSNFSIVNMT